MFPSARSPSSPVTAVGLGLRFTDLVFQVHQGPAIEGGSGGGGSAVGGGAALASLATGMEEGGGQLRQVARR